MISGFQSFPIPAIPPFTAEMNGNWIVMPFLEPINTNLISSLCQNHNTLRLFHTASGQSTDLNLDHKLYALALCQSTLSQCVIVTFDGSCILLYHVEFEQDGQFNIDAQHINHPPFSGAPMHIACTNELTISASCGDSVWVLHTNSQLKTSQLVGHESIITMTCFLNDNLLISISEDKTFKIWNLLDKSCVYQSSILSPLTFVTSFRSQNRHITSSSDVNDCNSTHVPNNRTQISFNSHSDKFCIGSDDGIIRFYEYSEKPVFLYSLQLNSPIISSNETISSNEEHVSVISAVPLWRLGPAASSSLPKSINSPQQSCPKSSEVETNFGIVNMRYLQHNSQLILIAVTFSQLLVIDVKSYNVLEQSNINEITDFEWIDTCSIDSSMTNGCVRLALGNRLAKRMASLSLQLDHLFFGEKSIDELISQIVSDNNVVGTWFEKTVQDITLNLATLEIDSVDQLLQTPISTLNKTLPEYFCASLKVIQDKEACKITSFLLSPDLAITPRSLLRFISSTSIHAKPTNKTDKPVTFRQKIKSSGYTQAPRTTMFKSKKSLPVPATKKPQPVDPIVYSNGDLVRLAASKNPKIFKHSAALTCLAYSPSGKSLLVGSIDKIVRCHRITHDSSSIKDFIGHDGMINSVQFSAKSSADHGSLFLSSSADGTARLWSLEKADPLLIFDFNKQISCAQFFYKDRFIALARKSDILIMDYSLVKASKGSVAPQINQHSHKLLKTYTSTSQQVNCLACPNFYSSQYIFSATSNRSIEIWDVNSGRIAQHYPQAQTRPIHHLCLVDQPDTCGLFSNHCFASMALTDSIKVWDTRLQTHTMHLHGHLNRFSNIKCSFSTCGNYITSGSEDNLVHVFDLRMSKVLCKLYGSPNIVIASAFNPQSRLEISSISSDAILRVYN